MRFRPRPAVAAGVVSATLLGAGILAVVVDSVTAPGNQVGSPALADGDTLQVGKNTDDFLNPAECYDFSGTTVSPMRLDSSVDQEGGTLPTTGSLTQNDNFCLLNVGPEPIAVYARFANVVSTELDCSPGEDTSTGGNDPADDTCGDGAGELDELFVEEVTVSIPGSSYTVLHSRGVLGVDWISNAGDTYDQSAPFGCWIAPVPSMCTSNRIPRAIAVLQPGEIVVGYFDLTWDDVHKTDMPESIIRTRESSQSDQLVWDIRFDAEPVS